MPETISTKQLKANRKNAKSGGVKSKSGKEISRYNAERHGILKQTITEYEKDAYEGIFRLLDDYYKPSGIIETLLVERMAVIYIKLFRQSRAENEFIKSLLDRSITEVDRIEILTLVREGYIPKVKPESAEKLNNIYARYETTLENRLYKAMHELERIQRMRKGDKVSAPIAIDINKMGSFGENNNDL